MNFDFSYPDIISQCNTMAYLNVISFCLLSGCGNIEMPHEDELNTIYNLLKGTKDGRMPKNIAFMSSLYKRCIPGYAKVPESAYDFRDFLWESKKVKKVIEPDTLSHSICCMTELVSLIEGNSLNLDNKGFIAYCIGTSSIKQANFLIDFLRVGDFYYEGEDVGDNSYTEYRIVVNTDKPDLKAQFLAAEALASVIRLIASGRNCSCSSADKYEKGLGVLPVICENVIDGINSISSRDLSIICLSLLAIHNNTSLCRAIVYNTVNYIGLELFERIQAGGDIGRSTDDCDSSSLTTLCNCMNCFIRLYQLTCIEEYQKAYMKLYDRIDSYWDSNIGLFVTSGKNKQRLSIKDIGCIMSALKAFRNAEMDPDLFMHADRQLSSFYSSAVINSKIFNNQFYPILQHEKMELPAFGTAEKDVAPVFSKFFEVKISKRKYYCEPDVFQSEYILLGCKYLLL